MENYKQREPLLFKVAKVRNLQALNFIYSYNKKFPEIESEIHGKHYIDSYEDYVIKYILEKLIERRTAYNDLDAFKFIYDFAKSKGVIPNVSATNTNEFYQVGDKRIYLIKLLTAAGDINDTGANNKLLNFLLVDNYSNMDRNILIKNILAYSVKKDPNDEDYKEYIFDFDNFYKIIGLKDFGTKEKVEILTDILTLSPDNLYALYATLQYLSLEDIRDNFDASVIFSAAANEGINISEQVKHILYNVNNLAPNLRVPNLQKLRSSIKGRGTISLFAYWAYKYSNDDKYLDIAKSLAKTSSTSEKLILNGEEVTVATIIERYGSEKAKETFTIR